MMAAEQPRKEIGKGKEKEKGNKQQGIIKKKKKRALMAREIPGLPCISDHRSRRARISLYKSGTDGRQRSNQMGVKTHFCDTPCFVMAASACGLTPLGAAMAAFPCDKRFPTISPMP